MEPENRVLRHSVPIQISVSYFPLRHFLSIACRVVEFSAVSCLPERKNENNLNIIIRGYIGNKRATENTIVVGSVQIARNQFSTYSRRGRGELVM